MPHYHIKGKINVTDNTTIPCRLNYLTFNNVPMIECVLIFLLKKKLFLTELLLLLKEKFLHTKNPKNM